MSKKLKIGSFVAVNNGVVEGCAADIKIRSGSDAAAGFVFENNSTVKHSVSVRCIKGKNSKGFYIKNTGKIEDCGYISPAKFKRIDKNGDAFFKYGNPECFISSDTETEEIRRILGLDVVWQYPDRDKNASFIPDIKANSLPASENIDDAVRISTPDDLKKMIEAVNSGDKKAAAAVYILDNDIDMHGAKLSPIGNSESTAFCGAFDGNGKTISNFTVDCAGVEYAGFFGYTKNAKVTNLIVDYLLKAKDSVFAGGMVGSSTGGGFVNCQVRVGLVPGHCTGGFAGKNTGYIRKCYVCGKIAPPVVIIPWIIGAAVIITAILILLLVKKLKKSPYQPDVIDPNQTPTTEPDSNTGDPLPDGTSRISLELNQDIYVKGSTMVGQMDYVNPKRSTHDVVVKLCVSDAELTVHGYDLVACGIRTRAEMDDESYDAEKSYTELYRSGRLQIGYKLSYLKLSTLPNGEGLKVGDYETVMMIDAYDPKTNEKSIVNAQAQTTIHILDQ